MRAAWRWMTQAAAGPRRAADVVRWWEARRPAYNLFLLAAGVPAYLLLTWVLHAAGALHAGDDAVEPLALVLLPVAANAGYCLGALVECAAGPERQPPLGPALMRLGLVFTVAVMLLPSVVWLPEVLARSHG